MNRTEHLLSILAEECAEVAQRASKALRFGLREIQPGQPYTNAERMYREFYDLAAMFEMLEEGGSIGRPSAETRDEHVNGKKAKVEKFLELSFECGTLKQHDGDGERGA